MHNGFHSHTVSFPVVLGHLSLVQERSTIVHKGSTVTGRNYIIHRHNRSGRILRERKGCLDPAQLTLPAFLCS